MNMLLTFSDPEAEWCDGGGDQFAPRGLPTLLYSSKLNKDANDKHALKTGFKSSDSSLLTHVMFEVFVRADLIPVCEQPQVSAKECTGAGSLRTISASGISLAVEAVLDALI